jgi:AcrR family transcriptional regulator
MPERLTAIQRQKQIAQAAYRAAQQHGFTEFTRNHVAAEAQCATGSVSRYFDERKLRIAALQVALRRFDYAMLEHALVGPYANSIRLPRPVRHKLVAKLDK